MSCSKCTKSVEGMQTYKVEGATYHRACFDCVKCGKKLAGTTFLREAGDHNFSCQASAAPA